MQTVADNVKRTLERVENALRRAGGEGRRVTVVAVTKTFGDDMVRAVIDAGIRDVGENRVQELVAKQDAIGRDACRWHLVGPLQRNKAPKVAGRVDLVHSIDSARIAETLDRLARERDTRMPVLLEVNTSGEATKHGVAPEDASALADRLVGLTALDWQGLMTIGPLDAGDDATRRCFRALAQLAVDLRARTGLSLPELSMGMSDDFEIAIEEGSTMIRVGRGITGERA